MADNRFARFRMDKGVITQQGFLRAPAFFTRTGVFLYRRKDGRIVRELRHPDDVFHEDSLASLQMAPLTDDHPDQFVTPDNVKTLSVGWISEAVKREKSLVGGTVVVADKNSIEKVDSGKVELSCGYTADIVDEQGTYDGEPYDCRQKNIRYNHVALVERGRAGPQVRLRLDSEAFEVEREDSPKEDPVKMKKIKIGDKDFDVSEECADAFEAFQKKAKEDMDKAKNDAAEATKKLDTLQAKVDGLTSEKDTVQAKLDSANEKIAQHKDGLTQERIDKEVNARLKIVDAARAVVGNEFKADGKSNLELMKEVIKKERPKLDLADKSETYIQVTFDSIVEGIETKEARKTQLGAAITDNREDKDFDSKSKRDAQTNDSREAWKQPLAASKK